MINIRALGGIGRALKIRNYRIYWLAAIQSLIGTWVQTVATGWLAWQLTESPAWLGAIAFAEMAPTLLVSPLAGVFIDRREPKQVLIVTQIFLGVQATLLAVLTGVGWITAPFLLALSFVKGGILAFNHPARLALVPMLVPKSELSTAIAINSATFHGARFVGPAVAGLVIVWGGVAPAFAVNAATFFVLVTALTQIRLAPHLNAIRKSKAGVFADLAEGLGYLRHHDAIRSVLIMLAAVAVVLQPYMDMLPGFAADVYREGADALAIMTAATGLGAMCAALWLAQRGTTEGLTRVVTRSLLAGIVGLIAFTATDQFVVALPALAVVGFAFVATGTSAQILLQNTVASEMRARVMGIYGTIFLGGPAAGALILGGIASWVGLRPTVAGAAVVGCVAWLLTVPALRRVATVLESGGLPAEASADSGSAQRRP